MARASQIIATGRAIKLATWPNATTRSNQMLSKRVAPVAGSQCEALDRQGHDISRQRQENRREGMPETLFAHIEGPQAFDAVMEEFNCSAERTMDSVR